MSDVIDLSAAERRMDGAVDSVKSNFATIRTGRANPSILDRIEVEVYGTKMALRSVANIGAPEARLLTVTPFDPNSLKDIERAIRDANIGLNPQNDGKILRLPIPELTEERRRDLISAGPLSTPAASGIPGFSELAGMWTQGAPLGWDSGDAAAVADGAIFLLSDMSRAITGEIVHVDGGFHCVGGALAPSDSSAPASQVT
jgi:hypothetical protein